MDMTLNTLIKKLIKNNKGQYGILMGSIIFAVMMIGGYGLIQFSPTITDVLADGGSTMMISLTMFAFTLVGTFAFVIYAHSLFLKYKSKEIGVFISLGIKRENVKKIVVKELRIIVLISTIIGLILSIPLSYLSWTMLTGIINTAETTYKFGWVGLSIAVIFSIVAMIIMILVTGRYIKKVDIIKILKITEEVEDIKGDKYILGLIGAILVPVGIVLFNVAATSDGLFGSMSFVFLILALVGLYLLIVQITSIGAIVKKISPKRYYKNIVFFNLVKLKGKQYTKTLFVTTILVGVTIFGISFNATPMVDGLLTAINDPYDYALSTSFQQEGFGEDEIKDLAEEYNVGLKDFKSFNSILVSQYADHYDYRSNEEFVSEDDFNKIAGENIDVKKGTYVEFISGEKPIYGEPEDGYEQEYLNGATQDIFKLKYDRTICKEGVLSLDNYYHKDFIIIDSTDYEELNNSVDERFRVESYMFNVSNWKETKEFSDELFNAVVKASDNKWCDNFSEGAKFELNKLQDVGHIVGDDYNYEEVNEETELMAKKWWSFDPSSKYSRVYNSITEYAIYILLMLYIAVIAFVSAIMVVGIKILNTMWQDKSVYKNITFLGSKKKDIKSIVTKQVMLIYFTPLVLGTIITLFLLKQMLTVTGMVYINEAFLASCLIAIIVVIIQIGIFFFIRNKAIKECTNFENV